MTLPIQIPGGVPEGTTAAPLALVAVHAPSPFDLLIWAAITVLVAVAVVHAVLGVVLKWRDVFPRPPDADLVVHSDLNREQTRKTNLKAPVGDQ